MYKFRYPIDSIEARERLNLVEDRGDLILLEDADPYWEGRIRPQAVYLKEDMEEVR